MKLFTDFIMIIYQLSKYYDTNRRTLTHCWHQQLRGGECFLRWICFNFIPCQNNPQFVKIVTIHIPALIVPTVPLLSAPNPEFVLMVKPDTTEWMLRGKWKNSIQLQVWCCLFIQYVRIALLLVQFYSFQLFIMLVPCKLLLKLVFYVRFHLATLHRYSHACGTVYTIYWNHEISEILRPNWSVFVQPVSY